MKFIETLKRMEALAPSFRVHCFAFDDFVNFENFTVESVLELIARRKYLVAPRHLFLAHGVEV